MNQESFVSKHCNIVASLIAGGSLIISAVMVGQGLHEVAESIRMHPVPSFGSSRIRVDEPVVVHVDNGSETPLKVETKEAK
jgi:hypothetical protein